MLWRELRGLHVLPTRDCQLPSHLNDLDAINESFIAACASRGRAGDFEDVRSDDALVGGGFCFRAVSENEVLTALTRIRSSAVGGDGISARMLRLCMPMLLEYVTHIVNCCIHTSTVPDV